MENEIWKTIKGYETNYEISNLGRVRSIDRIYKRTFNTTRKLTGKILKPFLVNGNYLCVYLCNDAGKKSHKVHRLVATHFIPNEENKREVNHIDGNRQNNQLNNLEWNTRAENNLHSYLHLGKKPPMKGKTGSKCKNSKQVVQLTKQGETIKVWNSITEAQNKLGIAGTNISKCCRGYFETMGGYKWKYLKTIEQ